MAPTAVAVGGMRGQRNVFWRSITVGKAVRTGAVGAGSSGSRGSMVATKDNGGDKK